MLIDHGRFHQSPDGAVAAILSDDEVTNHAFFDKQGYLHLCQARGGNRLHEVELAPSEVEKLAGLIDQQRIASWKARKGR